MMIVTHFDKNFFDWFEITKESLEITNPGLSLFVYGTNLTEDQINKIKNTNSLKVHVENKILEFDGIQERKDGSGEDAKWKIMMQCQLAEAMVSAMEKNPFNDDEALLINADMLFAKPVKQVLRHISESLNAECLLWFSKDRIAIGQIQNTTIYSKISDKMIDFFKHYDSIIKEDMYHYADQVALLSAFNSFKDKIRFGQLPWQFIDGNFRQESFILSAHAGDRKRNKAIFLEILKGAK